MLRVVVSLNTCEFRNQKATKGQKAFLRGNSCRCVVSKQMLYFNTPCKIDFRDSRMEILFRMGVRGKCSQTVSNKEIISKQSYYDIVATRILIYSYTNVTETKCS